MIVKRSQRYFKEQQEYLGYVNGQVEEVYGGHNIVKAFNKEDDVIDELTEIMTDCIVLHGNHSSYPE